MAHQGNPILSSCEFLLTFKGSWFFSLLWLRHIILFLECSRHRILLCTISSLHAFCTPQFHNTHCSSCASQHILQFQSIPTHTIASQPLNTLHSFWAPQHPPNHTTVPVHPKLSVLDLPNKHTMVLELLKPQHSFTKIHLDLELPKTLH